MHPNFPFAYIILNSCSTSCALPALALIALLTCLHVKFIVKYEGHDLLVLVRKLHPINLAQIFSPFITHKTHLDSNRVVRPDAAQLAPPQLLLPLNADVSRHQTTQPSEVDQ